VFYQKVPRKDSADYSVDHTAASYVYDPQGRLRLFVRYGTPLQDWRTTSSSCWAAPETRLRSATAGAGVGRHRDLAYWPGAQKNPAMAIAITGFATSRARRTRNLLGVVLPLEHVADTHHRGELRS
jgi:hypothetical protein